MMKTLKWTAIFIMGFFAGYFTHATISEKNPVSHETIEPAFRYNNDDESSHLNAKTEATKIVKIEQPKIQTTSAEKNIPAAHNNPTNQDIKSPDDNQHETKDFTHDKSLPKPFDKMLEKVDGDLHDKYKNYAADDHKDDWDIRMQSQITDFILSRPAATDIKIDSVNCNANICEIRLEEQKRFLLMATFAELLQESWLINNATGQFSFDDKYGYMLLERK